VKKFFGVLFLVTALMFTVGPVVAQTSPTVTKVLTNVQGTQVSSSVQTGRAASVMVHVWAAGSTDSSVQVQQSSDGTNWYNVGAAIVNVGTGGKILFGPSAPLTRVAVTAYASGSISATITPTNATSPYGWKDLSVWTSASTGLSSVGLSMPAEFSVANSPLTNDGTLAVTKATQVKNTFFVGPTTGADAAPAFRAMVLADFPGSFMTGPTGTGKTSPHVVVGRSGAMSSGTKTVTLSGAAVFTSGTSYSCTVSPVVAVAANVKALGVTYTDGTAFVITSADGADTADVAYVCAGN
jgi:hypothetical protein